MKIPARIAAGAFVLTLVTIGTSPAGADQEGNNRHAARAFLSGLHEVPVVSSVARGTLRLSFDRFTDTFEFELSYSGLESDVTQAHIHVGQDDVNGGVAVFLCSNLPDPPPGTEACPLRSGTVSGTIGADQVIGPSGQGVSAGEFEEFRRLVRKGKTYANVHTALVSGGEIRGQIW